MTVKRIPTKQELLQLQKLYRTDKKIGQALGNVPESLVAYWRRKKGIGKSIFPKYTLREIGELWERFGDDLRAGQELEITKQAFYRWRKKYNIFNRPAILRLEQLELKFFDEQRLSRSGEKVWPAQTFLQKIVSFHDATQFPTIGQVASVPVDLLITIGDQGIVTSTPSAKDVSKGENATPELFDSFQALFEAGYFRANQVIVADRPELAALAATTSFIKIIARQTDLDKQAPKFVDIEVTPTLKLVLSSASSVRQNTFDTACRILEAIRNLDDRTFMIELSGPGVEGLPLDDRLALLGYTFFLTGRQAIIEPDQTFLNFLSHFGNGDMPVPFSDKNASLLDTIAVTMARHRSPIYSLSKREFVSDAKELASKQLRRVRMGPLLGGGLEDFHQAAQVLRGSTLKKHLQLYMIPSSPAVFAEALRRRFVHAIVEAGGRVGNVCFDPPMPKLAPNEFELTTELCATESECYLASVQTIIQSLHTGRISRRAFE